MKIYAYLNKKRLLSYFSTILRKILPFWPICDKTVGDLLFIKHFEDLKNYALFACILVLFAQVQFPSSRKRTVLQSNLLYPFRFIPFLSSPISLKAPVITTPWVWL